MVDDKDFDLVNTHVWHAHKADGPKWKYYARTNVKRNGKWRPLYMHRLITEAGKGQIIDHIDNNGLNNQRSNLRFCSGKENQRRQQPKANGFKGIWFNPKSKTWTASIKITIGTFKTAEEAARAYDKVASEYFGEFAWLNFS